MASINQNTKPRLLLVASNDLICTIFRHLFERFDYYVVALDNAKEGSQALTDDNFEIIICDFDLNDSNGLKFFKSMKNACANKMSVLMVNLGDIVNISEVKDCGIKHIIEKPFAFEEILRIIEDASKDILAA